MSEGQHDWVDEDASIATSYNPRNTSITEFDRQKHLNAFKLLRNELNKLLTSVSDETKRILFAKEMGNFERLFNRFLLQRTESLQWDHVKGPTSDMVQRQ